MSFIGSPLTDRKRVKVYELRENDWFDRGTGFCGPPIIQEDARIFVESEEEPGRLLLEVKIKKNDSYQKQQDTLIVWTDPGGVDMALSFQEAEGCSSVWNMISEVQQRLPDKQEERLPDPLVLPEAALSKLDEIEESIRRASHNESSRHGLAKWVVETHWLDKFVLLAEMAEDLEDLDSLHKLCTIVKSLVLFNESSLIEAVVEDKYILGILGALEYDPDFPLHKANHRHYLSDASKFKEVVRIEDVGVRQRIHYVYRLQYLKDVVLARVLDDPTFNVLNSMIFFHQHDIVGHLQGNTGFIKELFNIVATPSSTYQRKKDAILFVQQSCSIAKSLQPVSRNSLYQNFIACGLFPIITYALQQVDETVRVAGTDILVAIIDHDAVLMRSYVFKSINEKTKPITETLIELLLVETDLGIKAQIADAIKVLMDPSAAGASATSEKATSGDNNVLAKMRGAPPSSTQQMTMTFLSNFYDQSAAKLFLPLKELEKRPTMNDFSIQEVSLFTHLVEILGFFIKTHAWQGKAYVLSEGLAARIAQLMGCPEKHLKLTALKYFRACIGLQDEYHNRHIISQHLFEPILGIITETMPRDNLLNSACLELFETIRRENVKPIILHLVETYRERLDAITYVDTFRNIIARYEQLTHPQGLPHSLNNGADPDSSFMTSDGDTPNTRRVIVNGGGSRWQGLKDTDADEEAYFNTSDGDDDDDEDELAMEGVRSTTATTTRPINGASPLSKPLVDYVDDDEDNDTDEFDAEAQLELLKKVASNPVDQQTTLASSFSAEELQCLSPSSSFGLSLLDTPARKTPTPPPSTPPTTSTTTLSHPPSHLSEKRRRDEDDDDDELGRLASVSTSSPAGSVIAPKRRLSSSVASDASWDIVSGASDNGSPDARTSTTTATRTMTVAGGGSVLDSEKAAVASAPRQSLRRKKAFGPAGKEGASSGGVGAKKIAFSLGAGVVKGGKE